MKDILKVCPSRRIRTGGYEKVHKAQERIVHYLKLLRYFAGD